jgi:hypothetical protein
MNTLPSPSFKKTDVILLDGTARIVIAKLQAEWGNPATYSVCNADDLKWALHGISLQTAIPAPVDILTEEVRRKAAYFA